MPSAVFLQSDTKSFCFNSYFSFLKIEWREAESNLVRSGKAFKCNTSNVLPLPSIHQTSRPGNIGSSSPSRKPTIRTSIGQPRYILFKHSQPLVSLSMFGSLALGLLTRLVRLQSSLLVPKIYSYIHIRKLFSKTCLSFLCFLNIALGPTASLHDKHKPEQLIT